MEKLTKQQIKENWVTEEAFDSHKHAGDLDPEEIVFTYDFVMYKLKEIELIRELAWRVLQDKK